MSQFTKLVLSFVVLIFLTFCYDLYTYLSQIWSAEGMVKEFLVDFFVPIILSEALFLIIISAFLVLKIFKRRKTNYLSFYFLLIYTIFHLLTALVIVLNAIYYSDLEIIIMMTNQLYSLILMTILIFKIKDFKKDEAIYFMKPAPVFSAFFSFGLIICFLVMLQCCLKLIPCFTQIDYPWYMNFENYNFNSTLFFLIISMRIFYLLFRHKTKALISLSIILLYYCIDNVELYIRISKKIVTGNELDVDFSGGIIIALSFIILILSIIAFVVLAKQFKKQTQILKPIEP